MLARWSRNGRRLRPVEVVEEYERIIHGELDLQREAANASQLKRHFQAGDLVYVPAVHWPLTRQQVMVSERIYGVPISDIDTLRAKQVDVKLLAERGVEIFFTQVFRDSFFHADMHPGNIFVDCYATQKILVTLRWTAQLSVNSMTKICITSRATCSPFFNRIIGSAPNFISSAGWISADTPIAEFESAMRTLCEPVFERPLAEISFGQMVVNLFRTAGSSICRCSHSSCSYRRPCSTSRG